MRQAAEWGMRSIQSLFPRLKDQFVHEKGSEQRIVLKMIVLLYNHCACLVGINQIRNVYLACLNVDAGQEINNM